jgi:phosphatidylinositol dimannoside acyltransferase
LSIGTDIAILISGRRSHKSNYLLGVDMVFLKPLSENTTDPLTQQLTRRAEFEEQGLMIVGIHLSNFDLVMQYLCMQGIQPLALTIPDPQGGRSKEFEMRRKAGVNLVPASVNAYRQALRHLQHGGMVVTGIDRPIPTPPVRPLFFGRPASLPMHHIFIAMKAQVPVVLITSCLQPDGITRVVTTEPIELEHHPDRDIEALRNAEKVLSVAEGIIRTYPQQWSMSLPVWPELLGQVP